ncbi:hypothetical protein DRN73_07470 [Candidatus Pacearchaeota archaeon]|nr:MAG: hypothetical protein DRN73_07470 [Candidatus Pacearchaeota archaeon]
MEEERLSKNLFMLSRQADINSFSFKLFIGLTIIECWLFILSVMFNIPLLIFVFSILILTAYTLIIETIGIRRINREYEYLFRIDNLLRKSSKLEVEILDLKFKIQAQEKKLNKRKTKNGKQKNKI